MARLLPAIILLLGTVGLLGCGASTSAPPPDLMPSFGAAPDQTVTSASGALTIAVRFSPDPPTAGSDAAQLAFTDALGLPISGLELTVVPWMPAHGHGTSVDPGIAEMTPGVFVASPLYLFMPGSWELRMTIGGTADDTATAAFEIP
jgi:hypothetical protein